MKGITHFVLGVAWASCFPPVVRDGIAGHATDFVLGGLFGLLPDTIDFKLYRYLYPHHIELTPDPNRPDPELIADAVADSIHQALLSTHPVRILLNTVPVGAGEWRSYTISFNRPAHCLEVEIGPVLDAGLTPQPASPTSRTQRAIRSLACDIKIEYEADIKVEMFDGPLLELHKRPDGRIEIGFIPWHREWTHSLTVGILAAAGPALCGDLRSGAVAAGAWWLHTAVDQTGLLGCNLFYPFTRRRTPGLLWADSASSGWNFALVWFGLLLIIGNIWAQAPTTAGSELTTIRLLVWAGLAPLLLYRAGRKLFAVPTGTPPPRRRYRQPD